MKVFEELAQNGHGIGRAAQRADVFLSCLAARIRALCASGDSSDVRCRYCSRVRTHVLPEYCADHLSKLLNLPQARRIRPILIAELR
jgi:hypothetical protein